MGGASSACDAASRAGDSAIGLGTLACRGGVGGESIGGVVLTPFVEPLMEPLVEPLMEASSSDVLVRGKEARLTTLPMRDHLDLPGELMVG